MPRANVDMGITILHTTAGTVFEVRVPVSATQWRPSSIGLMLTIVEFSCEHYITMSMTTASQDGLAGNIELGKTFLVQVFASYLLG